ncbi:unnamed protein product [Lepeophtheirus salmonis]|uniref:(salmon louse) hypothetical protein n=1 Tax=Lepeophtheirus salmonis TaxID=72036 RepID=A0A7R8H744_LEPSM|nr:unnamed protein product [Lepeophtheirus salmonis]CAF2911149.1 unnamed protein product [Lepeophtheirus salmonis]
MDIFKSNKGVNKISFRGYSYRKNTTNISTQCWRCDIKTCPGTATTDINYTLDGVIPVEKRHHNHPPDLARTELLVAIDKMYLASNLTHEAQCIAPKRKSLTTKIQRKRKRRKSSDNPLAITIDGFPIPEKFQTFILANQGFHFLLQHEIGNF